MYLISALTAAIYMQIGQRKQFQRIQEILRQRMAEVDERIHTLADLKLRMQERITWAEREITKVD